MRIFSSTSCPLVKEYLGVKLNQDTPFLKSEENKDKTEVKSCALKALTGYTKPEMEQEIILDLLIRKLEMQDVSDPKLMDGLDGEEAQFVRKEVNHLLGQVFIKMKEKHLDAEGKRKARHKLAQELSRHKTNHFHHSLDLIRDFNSNVGVKNKELAARVKEKPIEANSRDAIDKAAAEEMKVTGNKRMGRALEVKSAFFLKNPVFERPINLGADVMRHVHYLSAKIGSKILFQPLKADRSFENVAEYLKGFFEGQKIPESAQERILKAWRECKSSDFDKSFDKFHQQLANGKIEGETGKQLARLFTAMSQIHYTGSGVYINHLIKANETKEAKGIAYQFDDKGGVAVKSHCTFHRPDSRIKIVNTMKSSPTNPSEWTSNIEVVIEVHIGRSDKETRERLKQINAEVVQPLLEHGFHVRVMA